MAQDLKKVKVKKGTFYISSKEDQGEGWTKNEFKNPQNKDETLVRYHRELSIEGEITYLAMKEDKYAGNVLSLIVNNKEKEESYSLQIPIMDTGGTVRTTNQYFNSIAGVFKNVNKGDTITMFVNTRNEDKNGNLYRNIVVLNEDGKLIKSDFSFTDSPKWVVSIKEDEFGKEVKEYDATESNKFYIGKFKESLASFGASESKEPTPEPKEAYKPVTQKEEKKYTPHEEVEEEDDSDLPF
jgi:hypothetical protein